MPISEQDLTKGLTRPQEQKPVFGGAILSGGGLNQSTATDPVSAMMPLVMMKMLKNRGSNSIPGSSGSNLTPEAAQSMADSLSASGGGGVFDLIKGVIPSLFGG